MEMKEIRCRRELYVKVLNGKKLLNTLSLLKIFFDNITDAIYFKDVKGHFVLINRAKAEDMGISSPQAAVGKTDFDFYSREFAEQAYMDEQRIVKTGKPIRKVEKVIYKDGRVRWGSVVKIPVMDDKGNITGIAGISTDVTKLKEVEEKLRESEERFRVMFEATRDGLVVVDSTGEIVYWNPAAESIFGYTMNEAYGRKIYSLIIPEKKLEHMKGMLKDFFKEKWNIKWRKKIIGCRKDGTLVPLEISHSKFQFKEKDYVLVIVRDVTEREKFLERIKREADNAKRYLDVAEVIIVSLDKNGKTTLINRKACEILGYKPEEIKGKEWFENFIPEKCREKMRNIFNVLIYGDAQRFKYYKGSVLTRNGEERIIEWYNTILKDNEGNVIGTLSSGLDVTEREKYELKLRDLAYRLNGLKPGGIFIYQSHEKCFKAFADLTFHRVPGLCMLRKDPEEVIEKYGIKPESIRIIASKPLKGYPPLDTLQKVSLAISEFQKENIMGVVLLDGLEYLTSISGFDGVFRFIQEKHLDFIESRSLLLMPFNPETLQPHEKALLLSEIEGLK